MVDQNRLDRCCDELVKTARARTTIQYGDLAKILGVASQSVGVYLNRIYEEEIARGRPDLTVVVVYKKTGMGRFNSRGGPSQSVLVDPDNPNDVQSYKDELARVYASY